MGIVKGGLLRLWQTFVYLLAFCCAGIILGIYSYFLAVLANRDAYISNYKRAVEGISGAGVVYTIFAVLLTCCLGGISFFAFLAIVLDICFIGGFIAIAVLTRRGADSCNAPIVYTPIGHGNPQTGQGYGGGTNGERIYTYSVKLGLACRLNKAAFAVSIIGAVLFLFTALQQIALVRSHRKEKRFGPSPANNYTSGYGKRNFWTRKNKTAVAADPEVAAAGGLSAAGPDMRPSHETGYTGSTVAGNGIASDKVESHNGFATHSTHTGYYTQPQGSAVNPYTNTTTATNY